MLSVMLVTTALISLVMLIVWEARLLLVAPFFGFFFLLEGVYFSSNIRKVQGACSPSHTLGTGRVTPLLPQECCRGSVHAVA